MANLTRRCAACKYLRRRCPPDCIFSPHFPSNDPEKFASIHKIYGAANVAKMLQQLPFQTRGEAVDSLHFEAQCRTEDPVYGCVGIIYLLQNHIHETGKLLAETRADITAARIHKTAPRSSFM